MRIEENERIVEESRETRWDTNVAISDDDDHSSRGCQIKASHHEMGMVIWIMTEGA